MRVRDLIEALGQHDPDTFVEVEVQSTRKVRWGGVRSVDTGTRVANKHDLMRVVVLSAVSEGKRDTHPGGGQ